MDAWDNSWRSTTSSADQQLSTTSPPVPIRHDDYEQALTSDPDISTLSHLGQRPPRFDVPYGAFTNEIAHPPTTFSSVAAVDGPVSQYMPTGCEATRPVPAFDPMGFEGCFNRPTYPLYVDDAFQPPRASAVSYAQNTFCGGTSSASPYGYDSGSRSSGGFGEGNHFTYPVALHSDQSAYAHATQQPSQLTTYSGQYLGGTGLQYVPTNHNAYPRFQDQAQAYQQHPMPSYTPTIASMDPPMSHVGVTIPHYAGSRSASNPPLELQHQTTASSSYVAGNQPRNLHNGCAYTTNSADDASIPLTDNAIRQILGLGAEQELSLRALADPPAGQRPEYPKPVLPVLAILGSPERRLTLQGICEALEDRFEWFRNNHDDKSWQRSIRRCLSDYDCFRQIDKPMMVPGKGPLWVVDFSQGRGTKHQQRGKKTARAD